MRKLMITFLAMQLVACGGGTTSPVVTRSPTVNSGIDQTVDEQTSVHLSGSGTDIDGTITGFSWTQTAGSHVTLSDSRIANPSFTAPSLTATETLIFQLTVTDNAAASASDSVNISVNPVNATPTADAGVSQSIRGLRTVSLSGNGTDSDGNIASFSWTQTVGTSVVLSDPSIANPTFVAPDIRVDETLTFELRVTDNEGASATDLVDIKVTANRPLVATRGYKAADCLRLRESVCFNDCSLLLYPVQIHSQFPKPFANSAV